MSSTLLRSKDVPRKSYLVLSFVANKAGEILQPGVTILGGQFYYHRKVHPRHDFDRCLAEKAGSNVGRSAPKHVGKQQNAGTIVDALYGPLNLFACDIHVVMPAD